MPRFLIEGSSDGSIFAETIEAATQDEAEALAIARLCEAWGEEGETLDDLGDCAMVSPYSADDYARDAGPELLENARYFDGVYEYDINALADDEPVELVVTAKALKDLRAAIAKAQPQ